MNIEISCIACKIGEIIFWFFLTSNHYLWKYATNHEAVTKNQQEMSFLTWTFVAMNRRHCQCSRGWRREETSRLRTRREEHWLSLLSVIVTCLQSRPSPQQSSHTWTRNVVFIRLLVNTIPDEWLDAWQWGRWQWTRNNKKREPQLSSGLSLLSSCESENILIN